MMKGILTVFIALIAFSFSQANELYYGLFFKSYSDLGKDRTSLILNNDKALELKEETTLSFDMYIRKEMEFGSIMHIISDCDDKIMLNFSADNKNNRYPSLIVNESFYPVSNKIEFENRFTLRHPRKSGFTSEWFG